MAFSRDELTARHPLATEPISLPPPHSIQQAVELEKLGNWHLAGEAYSQLEQQFAAALDIESRAKLLARSGTCFEIAWQPRPAARAYSDAARLLATSDARLQVAAELFNRAARQHFAADEFFEAGTSWRAAAVEFQKLGNALIRSNDNIPPIPFSAAGHTICGACLIAAGDAFLLASGEEVSACGAYWEAGNAYAQADPSPNSHAFNAYRKALNATIRFYRTLELERLRLTLPLTDEERAAELDPLKVLEEAAFRGNHHHQPPLSGALRSARARLETNRQLAAAFHEFSLQFLSIANTQEAGMFRAAEKERLRQVFRAERRYGKWALYLFWKLTSGYGESLARWGMTCFAALVSFTLLFFAADAISPVENWFDYFYFSVATFTSLGYGDIRPNGTMGKILACSEITVGLIMFGVLLSFLGNRFQHA